MRLTQLDAATEVDDLKQPTSNRLESLWGGPSGSMEYSYQRPMACVFSI